MAAFHFSETGSSFFSAVHRDILSKFGMQIVIHFLKEVPLCRSAAVIISVIRHARTQISLLHYITSLNLNPEVDFWLCGRHLVNSIWRHNPAMDHLIMTKFGRLKQNHMRRTKHGSRSKLEVKFQYGGTPFSETGSSFISAVDWDISSKFGMQTDFHLLKRMQSLAMNTEVAFGLYGHYLEK